MTLNIRKILSVLVLIIASKNARAGSGTWLSNPVSGDWNTAANWSSNSVPNSSGDTATFGASSAADVSISSSVRVNEVEFGTGASSFTITSLPNQALTSDGSGIVNNSGRTQNFVAATDATAGGFFEFQGNATAGELTTYTIQGAKSATGFLAEVGFVENTSAGNATMITGGSEAAGALGGEIDLIDLATAAFSTIENKGGTVSGAPGGMTAFFSSSTAADAVITADGAQAAGAMGGTTIFRNNSRAANSTLIATGGSNGGGGGSIQFNDGASGGTARVELFGNGSLDISVAGAAVTIGSLEGNGSVLLGRRKLSAGTNTLSTNFSGTIEGAGGSFTKLGTGTFVLSGASTYTGATTVSEGVLQVSNKTGSATGTGAVNVTAGTMGGKGIIAGRVTVGIGSGTGAILQPSVGVSQTVQLAIQSALTFKADSTYTCKLSTQKRRADQVIANGVTIESGAQFNFTALANKRLPSGTVFTLLSNTSATPISGTFANLPDGSTLTAGRNKLLVSYTGGDGNDLTLTVQ